VALQTHWTFPVARRLCRADWYEPTRSPNTAGDRRQSMITARQFQPYWSSISTRKISL